MRFMFLGMLGAYLLGNVYIFIRGWQGISALLPLFHCSKGISVGVKILFTLVVWGSAASLFIALFSRDAALPAWLQGGMYNIGSIWLVFILYMVLALLAVDILRIFIWHQPLREFGFVAAFAFTYGVLLYGYINYRNPKVEELNIDLESGEASKGAGILAGRDNLSGRKKLRIVAISDVHLGFATQKKHLQRYVEKINSLSPDIILIAGDLIDNSIKPVELQRMQEELGMLRAPGGIYMVPGNHEYISGIADVEAFLQKTPIVLLRDSVVMHPCGIALAGRDDRSNRGRLPVEELLGKVAVAGSAGGAGGA
ncbi:MAG: metallophosphoesterase, partial [Bacteroidales bacterium]|nr:metallophosphoesterase [Bacteroidales bacterium]